MKADTYKEFQRIELRLRNIELLLASIGALLQDTVQDKEKARKLIAEVQAKTFALKSAVAGVPAPPQPQA